MRNLCLAVGFIFSVCSAAADQDHEPVVKGQFELKRVSGEQWRAVYTFDQSVDAVKFDRPVWDYHKQAWHFSEDDYAVEYINDADEEYLYLKRADEAAIRSLVLDVSAFRKMPAKDYYAFSGFTDGGMSVYTGYFMVSAIKDGREVGVDFSAHYIPLEDNHVITRKPDRLLSQFVYFGPAEETQGAASTLVIDAALPSTIIDQTRQALPRVTEALSGLLAHNPDTAYQVFIAGEEISRYNGYSLKGGVQAGQILFTYKGRGSVEFLAENPEYLPVMVAHEVIHLYQFEIWPDYWNDHPWLHEGGADALALELMLSKALISEDYYSNEKAQSQASCLEGIIETSVDEAPANGKFALVYDCGSTLQWLVADALHKRQNNTDIFSLWQAMAKAPAAPEIPDGKSLYYSTLESLGIKPVELERLDDFLANRHDDPERAFHSLRVAFGLE